MKSTKIALILSSLFFLTLSPTGHSLDHGPMIYGQDYAPISPDRIHFNSTLRAYTTQANYDSSGGAFEELPNNGSYSKYSLLSQAAYDLSSRWRIIAGFEFATATSEDGTYSRETGEITEVHTGVIMAPIYKLSTRVMMELIGSLALNTFDDTTDTVMTGEGTHNVKAGARAAHFISFIELYSSLHVQWYGDGRSTRLPWSVGGIFHFSSIKLNAGLLGYESILDDDQTDTPSKRTNITDNVNAGSLVYGSVNPSLIDSQLSVVWQPNHDLQFEVGMTKTLDGKSTAEAISIYLSASLYWGGDDDENRGTLKKQRRKIIRKKPEAVNRFKTKQEEYDESLFDSPSNRKKSKRQRPIDVDEAIDETIKEFD